MARPGGPRPDTLTSSDFGSGGDHEHNYVGITCDTCDKAPNSDETPGLMKKRFAGYDEKYGHLPPPNYMPNSTHIQEPPRPTQSQQLQAISDRVAARKAK